jgi:hypothetical protein
MSDPVRVPPGLESLVRSLVGGSGDDERDQRTSTFAGGVALGVLVGAAIAGSTIWQRRQAHASVTAANPAETPARPAERPARPAETPARAAEATDPG